MRAEKKQFSTSSEGLRTSQQPAAYFLLKLSTATWGLVPSLMVMVSPG